MFQHKAIIIVSQPIFFIKSNDRKWRYEFIAVQKTCKMRSIGTRSGLDKKTMILVTMQNTTAPSVYVVLKCQIISVPQR